MAVALAATFLLACSSGARRGPSKYSQKLVILGFDGMDPHLLEAMDGRRQAAEHREARAQGGGMYPLQTTHSPESPTAWASFATGVNAGKHNIYDFLVRDTSTYLPDLGMVTRTPPKFLFNYFPISKPKLDIDPRRHLVLGRRRASAGVRSDMLTVPVTFPPEDVANGELLSGLPLPDIRGHDGHVLLLRDRSEPLRRRQHRDGRHPQASRLRGGHGVDRARRSAEPDRPAADSRRFARAGPALERQRSRAARGAAGRRRTSGCR